MDANSFLMSLRRFITRRGKPFELLSDQGTTLKEEVGNCRKPSMPWNLSPENSWQLSRSGSTSIQNTEKDDITASTVVLIVDQHTLRALWQEGTVKTVIPGADGRVRTAIVQVKDRTYTHPVVQLIRLPARYYLRIPVGCNRDIPSVKFASQILEAAIKKAVLQCIFGLTPPCLILHCTPEHSVSTLHVVSERRAASVTANEQTMTRVYLYRLRWF